MPLIIATIASAIAAALSGVDLIDKVGDQIDRFRNKRPEPAVPHQHRMTIAGKEGDIVASMNGHEVQRITKDELAKLPEEQLDHIRTYEASMKNHYRIWSAVYPQLALSVDPIAKARIEAQLEQVIADMRGDLNGILGFLETCGLQLDDHYMNIRDLVNRSR